MIRASAENESKTLRYSALLAILLEAFLLTAVGWHSHWLAHPQKTTGLDASQFIEAQVITLPPEAHLVSHSPSRVRPSHEIAISHVAGRGRKAKPQEKLPKDENVTQAPDPQTGPPIPPTHGPIPVFNPAPVIPDYLRNADLSKTLVIEFFITAQGAVTARLLSSSGSEELDAIALSTVQRWQFRPAEQDHKPKDSKTKLRIVFDVH